MKLGSTLLTLALGLGVASLAQAQPDIGLPQKIPGAEQPIGPLQNLRPDLVILAMNPAGNGVQVKVQNKGLAKSGQCELYVGVFRKNLAQGKLVKVDGGHAKVPVLNPNQGHWVHVHLNVPLHGVLLRGFVDCKYAVAESNENNNRAARWIP